MPVLILTLPDDSWVMLGKFLNLFGKRKNFDLSVLTQVMYI